MSIQEIGIFGGVLAAVGFLLAFGRYIEQYDRKHRQGVEPEPPIKTEVR